MELQQVILNLLLNAAQAMKDSTSGQLQLRTGVEDGSIQVAVRDQGTGIDDETMNRLFEPFFTTKSDGIGMGLAINRTIIDAHAGRIWAERNDDGGLTFYFRIPFDQARPGQGTAMETASTDQKAEFRSASHAG